MGSEIQFYNTLSGQVEPFIPIDPNHIKLYVCGPTVYDEAHLGHARCYITWDILYRFLSFMDYNITYVRNITDVDDKILNRSQEQGQDPKQLTDHFTQHFHDVMTQLNILPPTKETKATDYIAAMIELIQGLFNKNMAYQAPDQTVYYNTQNNPHYGQLKKQELDDQEAGARVDIDPGKKNPMDFALWKPAPIHEALVWESPWGWGRPGWHLECSSMILKELGEQIDIHTGGMDLIFPHHENEIAQSEACTGKRPFVKYWMHNGFVNVSGEKMSKSLGNFSTIANLLTEFDANTIRYFTLTHHYRSPVDFSQEALEGAKNRIDKMSRNVQSLLKELSVSSEEAMLLAKERIQQNKTAHQASAENLPIEQSALQWLQAMTDDMNTAKALAALNEMLSFVNQSTSAALETRKECLGYFLTFAQTLGFSFDTASKSNGTHSGITEDLIQLLINVRQQAREDKNWALSDTIRDQMSELGIQIKDRKEGPALWEWIS